MGLLVSAVVYILQMAAGVNDVVTWINTFLAWIAVWALMTLLLRPRNAARRDSPPTTESLRPANAC